MFYLLHFGLYNKEDARDFAACYENHKQAEYNKYSLIYLGFDKAYLECVKEPPKNIKFIKSY